MDAKSGMIQISVDACTGLASLAAGCNAITTLGLCRNAAVRANFPIQVQLFLLCRSLLVIRQNQVQCPSMCVGESPWSWEVTNALREAREE